MPEVKKREVVIGGGEFGRHVVSEVQKMISEGYRRSTIHTITACPENARFESQTEKENILLLMRSHPITNLWWILMASFSFAIPFFWDDFPLVAAIEPEVRLSLMLTWYLILVFFVFQNFLFWFYNVYIVNDERIIDVDFFGLLYKNVNATQIRKIEDVNYSQRGVLSGFFDYGNVVIETASAQKSDDTPMERSAFTYDNVPRPDRVVRVITELMEQEEQEEYEGRTR